MRRDEPFRPISRAKREFARFRPIFCQFLFLRETEKKGESDTRTVGRKRALACPRDKPRGDRAVAPAQVGKNALDNFAKYGIMML